jgi:hypothetical protein
VLQDWSKRVKDWNKRVACRAEAKLFLGWNKSFTGLDQEGCRGWSKIDTGIEL